MSYNSTKYFVFAVFLLLSQVSLCQDDIKIDAFKVFNYQCYGKNDSIMLPDNCVGPKYYNYEEGSIIYFTSPDTVTINILCGVNAILTFNKAYITAYITVDSILDNGKVRSISYYDKVKNKYAPKDYISDSEITYEGVSEDQKYEYNMLFNMFAEDRRKN